MAAESAGDVRERNGNSLLSFDAAFDEVRRGQCRWAPLRHPYLLLLRRRDEWKDACGGVLRYSWFVAVMSSLNFEFLFLFLFNRNWITLPHTRKLQLKTQLTILHQYPPENIQEVVNQG